MNARPSLLSALLVVSACAAEPVDRFGAPLNHRPTATTCAGGASAAPRPPAMPPAGALPCAADGACSDPLLRCVDFAAEGFMSSGPTRYCVPDACQSDAACGAGRLCACPGEADRFVRSCVAAGCRVDGDCATGFCSPSPNGCSGQLAGWYCHTADDECHNDSDCPGSGGGTGQCYDEPDRSRWLCSPRHCG